MNSWADSDLMQKVRDGDVGRLAILFERYHRRLFGYFVHLTGNRELSEDLVQDVFFRMLKYRHTYQEENPFASWMYQIARNALLDSAQRRKGEVLQFDDALRRKEEPMSPEPDPDERLKRKQDLRLLRQALSRLPAEKREVLVLSRFQNLTYEQIAKILACEVGTVKVRVYRAIKALGEIFLQLSDEKAS